MSRSPETGYRPPEAGVQESKLESPERHRHEIIDKAFNQLILSRLERFNEGNNGLILKLRAGEPLPVEVETALAEADVSFGEDQVAKILKVYGEGIGLHEYEMQEKAYELVESQDNSQDFAKVPRPVFEHGLALNQEAKEKLSGLGQKMRLGNRAELLAMDCVPGEDLATILYRAALERHAKAVHLLDHLKDMDFAELQEQASKVLDFVAPGGKSLNEGERLFEERKVFNLNAEALFRFLDRKGFYIHPSIVAQMENTMNLFHENGLAFRDGHHRNFMISGDITTPTNDADELKRSQAYIIDFGNSVEVGDRTLDDVFHETDGDAIRNFPDDFAVIRSLKRFTVAPEKRAGEAAMLFDERLASVRKRMDGNPKASQRLERLLGTAEEQVIDWNREYLQVVGAGVPSEGSLEIFLATVKAVVEAHPERAAEAIEAVSTLEKRSGMPWLANRLAQAKSLLSK